MAKKESASTQISIRNATVRIRGIAAYAQSAPHDTDREEGETHDDAEKRTWLGRCHVDDDGNIIIPGSALKKCIDEGAARRGDKVQGRGTSTYKKFVEAGVMVTTSPKVVSGKSALKVDDMKRVAIFANSDGKKNSNAGRVTRYIPHTPSDWKAEFDIMVLDPSIPKNIVESTIATGGLLVGIGQWRPEKGGMNGRFTVESVSWG